MDLSSTAQDMLSIGGLVLFCSGHVWTSIGGGGLLVSLGPNLSSGAGGGQGVS